MRVIILLCLAIALARLAIIALVLALCVGIVFRPLESIITISYLLLASVFHAYPGWTLAAVTVLIVVGLVAPTQESNNTSQ